MPVEAAPIDLDVGVIYTHERDYMTRLISSLAASGQGLCQRLLLVDNCSATGVEEWSSIYPETPHSGFASINWTSLLSVCSAGSNHISVLSSNT